MPANFGAIIIGTGQLNRKGLRTAAIELDGPVRVDMKKVKARIKGIAGESNQVIFLLDT